MAKYWSSYVSSIVDLEAAGDPPKDLSSQAIAQQPPWDGHLLPNVCDLLDDARLYSRDILTLFTVGYFITSRPKVLITTADGRQDLQGFTARNGTFWWLCKYKNTAYVFMTP